jgi:hypothetical protein
VGRRIALGVGSNALASCEGKYRFDSAVVALEAARDRSRKGKKGGIYRCNHCRGWHACSPGLRLAPDEKPPRYVKVYFAELICG